MKKEQLIYEKISKTKNISTIKYKRNKVDTPDINNIDVENNKEQE